MFGLCFTYAAGILIIFVSYATGPIFAYLYRRYKLGEYAHVEWTTNATFHFQRMVYQGIESGEWTGELDDIPRTKPGEILAELPMRTTATVSHDVLGKNSTSDQDDQTHEVLELDSLVDSDDAVEMVSLPFDSTDRNSRVNSTGEP